MNPSLPRRFERELRARGILPPGSRVVAAVSGGSDSTALLELLAFAAPKLGFEPVAVVHVQHGLRGAEADLDAEAVRRQSARHGLRFELRSVDVPAEARASGESVEAVARRLRYHALFEVARPLEALVATGHTADDRLETLLLRLGRGEAGIAGPRWRRADGVVRPLLAFRRNELRELLTSSGTVWREDSTNATFGLRARLRERAIPELAAALGNSLPITAGRVLDRLLEDEALLTRLAEAEVARLVEPDGSFDSASVAVLPPPLSRRFLRLVAGSPLRHGTEDDLLAAISAPRGQRIAVGGEREALVGEKVRFVPRGAEPRVAPTRHGDPSGGALASGSAARPPRNR